MMPPRVLASGQKPCGGNKLFVAFKVSKQEKENAVKRKVTGRLRPADHAIFVHHVVLPSIYSGLIQNRRGFRSWYPSSPIKCGGRNVIVNVNVNEFI